MKLSEMIEKTIWKLRSMWRNADLVFEQQRSLIGITIELANEIERCINLEARLCAKETSKSAYKKIIALLEAENAELKRGDEKLREYLDWLEPGKGWLDTLLTAEEQE